jgi:hypothetical protein
MSDAIAPSAAYWHHLGANTPDVNVSMASLDVCPVHLAPYVLSTTVVLEAAGNISGFLTGGACSAP